MIGGKQQKKRYYLSEQAYDPGTGILNKRAIREYATDKIQEKPKSVYLAIIDVDDFKRINDTFGHLYGDEVLSRVSEIVRGVINDRGIALYRGTKMQRISAVGNYVNPIMNLPWIFDEAYQEYFDKQGVYTESQIIRLKNKCPEAYRKYTEQENGKFICMF